MRWSPARLLLLLLLPSGAAGCGGDSGRAAGDGSDSGARSAPTTVSSKSPGEAATAAVVRAPDLLGLSAAEVGRRLESFERRAHLRLTSDWANEYVVGCSARPGTVVRQVPAAGARLRGAVIRIRLAELAVDEFRGPCEPRGGELGPVLGPDAALARDFYRFAADPSLTDPFVPGDVWVGIEDGLVSKVLDRGQRWDLDAWRLDASYAERSGPFSALDVTAASGGYYELERGVLPTCLGGNARTPSELAGLRAVTLTAPADTISSCIEWWGVTLYVDRDRIRGVALRLGSP